MPDKFDFPKPPKLPFMKESSNPGEGPKIEDFLPAEFPAPPIPRFMWKSLKEK